MTSLYFITLNNKVLNMRVKSRTCIIGLSDKSTAKKMKKKIDMKGVKVSEIDYMRDEFYEMLKLNQFTLMIANDVKFNSDSFKLDGDILDSPNVSQEELASHFEKLYNFDV